MDARFEVRKADLLKECEVDPRIFDQVLPRLEQFMSPFVDKLVRQEQVDHALTFVRGLLSDLDVKNTESIAYRFGQERMPLQWFIGISKWDDQPLRDELVRQIGQELGAPDGVLVFDPSGFPKSGKESVGVTRQWWPKRSIASRNVFNAARVRSGWPTMKFVNGRAGIIIKRFRSSRPGSW
jgi:SRSO17 transposase